MSKSYSPTSTVATMLNETIRGTVPNGVLLGLLGLHYRQPVVEFFQAISGKNLWDPTVRFLTELPARTDPVQVLRYE